MSDAFPSMGGALAKLGRFIAHWPGECAVVGGLAVMVRGRVRPTTDADLIMSVRTDQLDDLLAHSRKLGLSYQPADEEMLRQGGLIRLALQKGSELEHIDVLIADDDFLASVLRRAEQIRIRGIDLPMATVEDLMLMKLLAARPLDIDDVLSLKDAHGATLDREYLVEWAEVLGLSESAALYLGDLLGTSA